MRVTLIYLGRRGAGNRISLELAQHLAQMAEVNAAISTFSEVNSDWVRSGVEILPTATYENWRQALASLVIPSKTMDLVRNLQKFSPDVLLFPMFHPWNAILQRRLAGVPSVVFVHDPRPHPDITGWIYSQFEQPSIRRATRVIVMSQALIPFLEKRGVQRKRVDSIPLGLLSSPSEKEPDKTFGETPVILFFGRIAPYKGINILLQAVARVSQSRPVHLLLAGEGNLKPFQSYLRAIPRIDILNHWIGENELPGLLSRANLLVLPYTSASQSGVIPIAAGFSLPVIATRTGGIPEQIIDDESGWLVQPGSVQALAEKILYALDHPEECRRVGRRLFEIYVQERNWNKITRMVYQSLESAIKEVKQSS